MRTLLRATVWSIASAALLFILYIVALFVASGYDPYFLHIDSCLDTGGQWDYQARRCVR